MIYNKIVTFGIIFPFLFDYTKELLEVFFVDNTRVLFLKVLHFRDIY